MWRAYRDFNGTNGAEAISLDLPILPIRVIPSLPRKSPMWRSLLCELVQLSSFPLPFLAPLEP